MTAPTAPGKKRKNRQKSPSKGSSSNGSSTRKGFVTVNTTSDGPMLEYAKKCAAHFLTIQEHHLAGRSVLTAAVKMRKLGYKLCAAAAVPSGKSERGTTGGVAIAVKNCYGIDVIQGLPDPAAPWTIYPGRAAGVRVQGLIRGGVLVISIYLITGEPPNSEDNWRILSRVGEILAMTKLPFVIGGDFQCSPEELRSTGWLEGIDGTLRAAGKATCTNAHGANEIDFFVVFNGLVSATPVPTIDLDSCVATHCPVLMGFHGNPRALTVKAFRTPKGFPKKEPRGPVRKLPPWPRFVASAGSSPAERMEELASYWMQQTEIELCHTYDLVDGTSGEPLKQHIGRGQRPIVIDTIPLAHPTVAGSNSDVRGSFWTSIHRRTKEIARWFNSYLADKGIGTLPPNDRRLWRRPGYTKHVVNGANRLVRRFLTPPQTIARLDEERLRIAKKQSKLIVRKLTEALNGVDVNCCPIGTWMQDMEAHVDDIEKSLAKQRSAEFGEWLDEQLKGGAGGIHSATKEQLPTRPDNLDGLEPGIHAAQAIAEREIRVWSAPDIWDAFDNEEDAVAAFDSSVWPPLMPHMRPPPRTRPFVTLGGPSLGARPLGLTGCTRELCPSCRMMRYDAWASCTSTPKL